MKFGNLRPGLAALCLICCPGLPAYAGTHAANDAAGIWWSPHKDAKLEMTIDARGNLSGRLIAVPEKDGGNVDARNPDPALRQRSLLGMTVFSGFRREAPNRWVQGQVYDAELGATFQANIWLEDDGRLNVRGYLGLPIFGRTEVFQRVTGPQPQRQQPGEPALRHLDTQGAAKPSGQAAP